MASHLYKEIFISFEVSNIFIAGTKNVSGLYIDEGDGERGWGRGGAIRSQWGIRGNWEFKLKKIELKSAMLK